MPSILLLLLFRRIALNEVYAHAVLGKHLHVVRYFSAWAEGGHMYIQNEFCNGKWATYLFLFLLLLYLHFIRTEVSDSLSLQCHDSIYNWIAKLTWLHVCFEFSIVYGISFWTDLEI